MLKRNFAVMSSDRKPTGAVLSVAFGQSRGTLLLYHRSHLQPLSAAEHRTQAFSFLLSVGSWFKSVILEPDGSKV